MQDEELLARFGKPRSELIQLVERHTLTVQAWLSSRSPQAARFSGRGVKASSTGFKIPLLNLALGCDFPAETSAEEIDKEIKAVVEFFTERNVPWYWWMSAQPSPKNIAQILERHGLAYNAPPLPAMLASLEENPFPIHDKNIRVWRARSLKDLQAASKIRRIAFKFPAGEATTYFEDMPSDWLDDSSPARLFLAGRDESEPVSIGAVVKGGGIAGVYVMATLPEHHRKGYGKAVLDRLLAEAKSSGGKMIALTASKAGFGLYIQFGFHRLFDFAFYSMEKHKCSFGG
ncbi:MAG: GNAT family N-acetyltransferase [Chloroflexi bacterium]|nr:GNAT family N-acetyltransferase [Chloroflexota bacterium]MCA2000555.1 GNAT family N-acetyltransferase [Chloroflexota bacterium]